MDLAYDPPCPISIVKHQIKTKLPHSITTWHILAVSMRKDRGTGTFRGCSSGVRDTSRAGEGRLGGGQGASGLE